MLLEKFRLDGQVALVTGASRGIGLAIAAGLAEAGADIVAVQRREQAPELAERVAAAGRALLPLAADVGDEQALREAVARAHGHFGRLDILVNNAGIQRRHPAEEFPLEVWDEVIGVNLRGVWLLCQLCGRIMLAQGRGKIVNIASLLSFQGGWTVPAYAAAKHGVAGLTKALANEWAGRGINVNAIAPGYTATDLNEALLANPERLAQLNPRIPAGRWATPEDYAGAALFLASAAADYVHGEIITVDGGWMGR
jgi:2-dehydro-3-deoxy-D-gluconate 5-dehydrogenase